jgi:hypothetical protein
MMTIEVTDEMIYAFAGEPEITATDAHAIEAGLTAALAIVERDYVSRWGTITERVPREFMDTSIMDGFKKHVAEHAKYMGAEVVDIDNPEITYGPGIFDCDTYRWKIRRTA